MPNYCLRKRIQISQTKQTKYHTHGVMNVDKPGTVQVVFYASAKCTVYLPTTSYYRESNNKKSN